MGKLCAALAECGVPQRDWEVGDVIDPDDTIYAFNFIADPRDQAAMAAGYRALVEKATDELYVFFAFVEYGEGVVWRVRPEMVESEDFRQLERHDENGPDEDPVTGTRGHFGPVVRMGQFYCRLWKERIPNAGWRLA